jgi:hypothetical protein
MKTIARSLALAGVALFTACGGAPMPADPEPGVHESELAAPTDDTASAEAGTICRQTVLCRIGDHFDRELCQCVPNVCAPRPRPCPIGTVWNPALCRCMPRVCPPFPVCRLPWHRDPLTCRCVPVLEEE